MTGEGQVIEGQVTTGGMVVYAKDPAPVAKIVTSPNAAFAHVLHEKSYELAALDRPIEGRSKHEFLEPTAFARWLKRRGRPEKTDVFVNREGASAVINPELREPHIAKLRLDGSESLQALNRLLATESNQAHIRRFAEFHADLFQDEQTHRKLLSGATTIEAHSKSEMTSQIDQYGNIAVSMSSNQQTITADIPGAIRLRLMPWRFVACVEIAVEIRLFLALTPAGPRFLAEAPGLEDALDDGVAELADYLDSALNGDEAPSSDDAERAPRFFVGIGIEKHSHRAAGRVPEIDPHLVELLGRLTGSLDQLDTKFGDHELDALGAIVAARAEKQMSGGEETSTGDPE